VSWFLPTIIWGIVVLVVLSVWAFSSAVLSLILVAKFRTALPEGFARRLCLGILSLAFAIMIFVMPEAVVLILMVILGYIAILLGLVLVVNAMRLRQWMKVFPGA
jgi:hypothetical protein